jgi:hypothetical protein
VPTVTDVLASADLILDPNSPLTWVNLGFAGLLLWSGIRGLIWLRPSVDQLKEDLKDLKDENKRLNTFLRETAVPALTTANDLSERSTEAITDATALMQQLINELKRRPRT